VATYNEVENVEPLIKRLVEVLRPKLNEFEVIVVDDNSPDKTFEKLLNLSQHYKMLRPVLRKSDHGLGPSVWDGIRAAKYKNIVVMDSDLSHCPTEIPEMLSYLQNGKVMVWRSRYVPGGKIEESSQNSVQYKLSRSFNYFIKKLLNIPILDTTNGFFAFKSEILLVGSFKNCFRGYGDFSFLFLYVLSKNNIIKPSDVIELSSVYRQRVAGQSKTKLLKVGVSYSLHALKARFSNSSGIEHSENP
jgi:dolichol-phosphate mannosyltransferase